MSNGSEAAVTVVDDKSKDTNMNGSNNGGLNAASKQTVVPALVTNISKDDSVLGRDIAMAGVPMSPKLGSEGAPTFKSVSNNEGAVQGGDGSGDVVMEGEPPSTKSVKYVGFSADPHLSHDNELAQIMVEIEDTQHIIDNSTALELKITKGDMTKLQHFFSEKKKTTTPKDDMEIEVSDPVDKPSKQVLDKNAAINSISSIRTRAIDNLVTLVWKYS